jgi:hypothetical protein
MARPTFPVAPTTAILCLFNFAMIFFSFLAFGSDNVNQSSVIIKGMECHCKLMLKA